MASDTDNTNSSDIQAALISAEQLVRTLDTARSTEADVAPGPASRTAAFDTLMDAYADTLRRGGHLAVVTEGSGYANAIPQSTVDRLVAQYAELPADHDFTAFTEEWIAGKAKDTPEISGSDAAHWLATTPEPRSVDWDGPEGAAIRAGVRHHTSRGDNGLV